MVRMARVEPEFFTVLDLWGGRVLHTSEGGTKVVVEQAAEVTADGSLSVEPEAWHARHYRRAVMGGAGVYQMNLRAFLVSRRFVSLPARPEPLTTPLALGPTTSAPNTAQAFERFKWAARGRVRHSVRWKTGKRPRRLRKLEALADLTHIALRSDRRAVWQQPLCPYLPGKRVKARRQAIKAWEAEKSARELLNSPSAPCIHNATLLDIVRAGWFDFWGLVLIRNYGSEAERRKANLKPIDFPEFPCTLPIQANYEMAAYFIWTGKRAELSALLASWKTRRPTLGQLLKNLQAAEYRAHLTRRVKPAPRRHRIRRPLHSRPRPPSAPLAPPVL